MSEKRANLEDQAFPKLSERQFAVIEKMADCVVHPDGSRLFEVGDQGFKFLVVKSGEVEILKERNGETSTVTVHGPGEFTGELNMLNGQPSFVSAVCRGETEVCELCVDGLKKLIKENSEISDLVLNAFMIRRQWMEQNGNVGPTVIGSRFDPDTFRIRDFLSKNRILHEFVDLEQAGDMQALLDQFEIEVEQTPIIACGLQGKFSINPSNEEIGQCVGIRETIDGDVYDLVVIGGGPSGLAAFSVWGERRLELPGAGEVSSGRAGRTQLED